MARSSTFVVGYLLFLICRTGVCYQMDAVHNLVFGAIISATDPVRCRVLGCTFLMVFKAAHETKKSGIWGHALGHRHGGAVQPLCHGFKSILRFRVFNLCKRV